MGTNEREAPKVVQFASCGSSDDVHETCAQHASDVVMALVKEKLRKFKAKVNAKLSGQTTERVSGLLTSLEERLKSEIDKKAGEARVEKLEEKVASMD